MFKATLTGSQALGPIVVPRDGFVQAFVQYPSGGTGTIELQGTENDTDYVTIAMTPSNSATPVTSLAAAGVGSADVSGFLKVQVKMTVAGTCAVTLSLPVV